MIPSESNWWERFFSGRNVLKWDDISTGRISDGWCDDIVPWIQIAEIKNPDLPLILPCLSTDGSVTWYAGSNSNRGSQRLSEEIMAFIGPSYSDYNQRPYILDKKDEIESAFAEGCSNQVFRFSPSCSSRIPEIRHLLKIYQSLIGRYKSSEFVGERSFSIIRGEFDRALLVGDESQARIKYEQLLRTGRLSADNILYLEVRLLSGLGLWTQITYDQRLLRALSDLMLPSRVLVDVIDALYRVYIEPVENISDPHAALQAFRDAGLGKYKRFFATRRGLPLPRVLKAFFLYELCTDTPEIKRLESFIDLLISEDNDGFNVSLRRLIPKTTVPEPTSNEKDLKADLAFDDFEYDRALELYIELPASKKRLGRMLLCATEIGEKAIVKKVLIVIDLQHEADISSLSPGAREKLNNLRKLIESPVVQDENLTGEDPRDGWLQWTHFVNAGLKSSEARAILQENSFKWDTKIFIEDESLLSELARVMGNAEGGKASVFHDAYPYLFEAFVLENDKPTRAYKPLLDVLLTNTVLLEAPSQDELELVRQLVSALVTIGLSEIEYDQLVSDMEELLTYQASISTMSWALDITEILIVHSCSSPESRLRFFVKVLDLARRVSHRLSSFHFSALELLCLDLEIKMPAELIKKEEEESSIVRQDLANKKIAIYTLTEQAGKRAATILKQLFPDVTVDVNNDKVCTDKLKTLAKNADIFVFAWKSSKHQAFFCVKNHRPEGWPILQPLGKGSSSIVREIIDLATNK